jgi:glutaredoxin-like protein
MVENREKQKVPQVVFRTRRGDQWVEVRSEALFRNRTAVVFALPGAYTPTCSTTHLPRYEELAPALRAAGVDDIYCVSVNDAFVMNAWARDHGVSSVQLLPDGNGDFSEAMGMLVDKRDLGFGMRSWRYSMLVRDGIIEKMFIEPEKPGDPFEVSDADTMLRYLDPAAGQQPRIALFTRAGCGHCTRAIGLLNKHNLRYQEIPLGSGVTTDTLLALTGSKTTPQVFVDGRHIGGADELTAYLMESLAR